MKNVFKVSLLVALLAVSTTQVSCFPLLKCLGAGVVISNVCDVACMMNSTPYWLTRQAEAKMLRFYGNNAAPLYSVLPTIQATGIELKLDLASHLSKEIKEEKKRQKQEQEKK